MSPIKANLPLKQNHRRNKRSSNDETEELYEVEQVLNKKRFKGATYYELKWVGCDDHTWERAKDCCCDTLIKEYEKRRKLQSADEDEDEWEVEEILDKRMTEDNEIEYLVKWKNWDGDHEWIMEEDCLCINLIAAYENPKLRKMWDFQGSNPKLWLDQRTIIKYMHAVLMKYKHKVNILKFEPDFPFDEEPKEFAAGLNIGPLSYKNHWYLVIMLNNHIGVCKRLLVGDPLNTLFGATDIRTHPVFKRLTRVYRRIPIKPLLITQMDRSDVCGYYLLAAFERALFLFSQKANFAPEKIFFEFCKPELIRSQLKPETNCEFSVALPVSHTFLSGPRCEFCNEYFEDVTVIDRHIKKEHFHARRIS